MTTSPSRGTGAKTALLITKGFRDIYEIGRINRPDAYNLFFRKHQPLVKRSLRFEVPERLTAEGEVDTPLDEAAVNRICDELVALGIEAVGIILLHSYRNNAHEERVRAIVQKRLPNAFVSCSNELSQEYREFERCSTVVANAFDHRSGPRVAYAETFASTPPQQNLARGCAIADDIASNDVGGRIEGGGAVRTHNDATARESLANEVVGVALEAQGDSWWQECTERLTSRTSEQHVDGSLRQPSAAPLARDMRTQHGAHGAVDVANRHLGTHRFTALDGGGAHGNQVVVQCTSQPMVLRGGAAQRREIGRAHV